MPDKLSNIEKSDRWSGRIEAANRVYKLWASRFKVETLNQYYEGYQWEDSGDNDITPYIVNLIYSTIEGKLPNMQFTNPEYELRPRPIGDDWNPDLATQQTVTKQDIMNFIVRRREFNLNEKHELCLLDAFFGFGVLHTNYSDDTLDNPYIGTGDIKNPLNSLYCKHIPFDRFRVSARANWDLSEGKWWGYFEFVPNERLSAYKSQLNFESNSVLNDTQEAEQYSGTGVIELGEYKEEHCPSNCTKVWYIWDFEKNIKNIFAFDNNANGNAILEEEDFKHCGISTLRYGKRRRGWYPLPPVFQWISPQNEINEVHQTMRIHRARYKRKYLAINDAFENEQEKEKLLYGPDGTVVTVSKLDAIKAVEDAPLDASNDKAMVVSYDDFNRVAATSVEQGRIQDRTTASQAQINEKRAQVRESKELNRVANFLVSVGYDIEYCLRQVKAPFWAEIALNNEPLLGSIQRVTSKWQKIPPGFFAESDFELNVKISSVSPIYQAEDEKAFLKFLAVITQYEVIAFSPALLREAAAKCGYRNQAVLSQFQQWAQLMAIGRSIQLQKQVGQAPGTNGIQPTEPGQLGQEQVAASTPPDLEQVANMIFGREGAIAQ